MLVVVDNLVVCSQMPSTGSLSVTVNYRTNVVKVDLLCSYFLLD